MKFERYIRNEESVEAIFFDGTDEMMSELLEIDPESFEVRLRDKNKKILLVNDGTCFIYVRPWDFIVFDSCGKVQTYSEETFELMFRDYANELSGADFAAQLYAIENPGKRICSDADEAERKKYLNTAKELAKDFIVVRRDPDRDQIPL